MLYYGKTAECATMTSEGEILVLQKDCNLVLYSREKKVLWESQTSHPPSNCCAQVHSDGVFSLKVEVNRTLGNNPSRAKKIWPGRGIIN